jgi:hypothetical protein
MTQNYKLFARAVIFNENNEFLLVEKNASQSIAPGKAMFPG